MEDNPFLQALPLTEAAVKDQCESIAMTDEILKLLASCREVINAKGPSVYWKVRIRQVLDAIDAALAVPEPAASAVYGATPETEAAWKAPTGQNVFYAFVENLERQRNALAIHNRALIAENDEVTAQAEKAETENAELKRAGADEMRARCAKVCRDLVDECGNYECYHGISPPQSCPNEECTMKTGYKCAEAIEQLK